MSKLLSALITAVFATALSMNAMAAKHMAGEAPKAEAKTEAKTEAKAEAKAEEKAEKKEEKAEKKAAKAAKKPAAKKAKVDDDHSKHQAAPAKQEGMGGMSGMEGKK